MKKTPEVLDAWFTEIARGCGGHPMLDAAVARIKAGLADTTEIEYRARRLVDELALTMLASLLVQAGNSPVADAFIASRLGARGDRNYGTLPRGLDIDTIVARGDPALG